MYEKCNVDVGKRFVKFVLEKIRRIRVKWSGANNRSGGGNSKWLISAMIMIPGYWHCSGNKLCARCWCCLLIGGVGAEEPSSHESRRSAAKLLQSFDWRHRSTRLEPVRIFLLLSPEYRLISGLIKIAIFLIKIKKIDFFDLNRIFLI